MLYSLISTIHSTTPLNLCKHLRDINIVLLIEIIIILPYKLSHIQQPHALLHLHPRLCKVIVLDLADPPIHNYELLGQQGLLEEEEHHNVLQEEQKGEEHDHHQVYNRIDISDIGREEKDLEGAEGRAPDCQNVEKHRYLVLRLPELVSDHSFPNSTKNAKPDAHQPIGEHNDDKSLKQEEYHHIENGVPPFEGPVVKEPRQTEKHSHYEVQRNFQI